MDSSLYIPKTLKIGFQERKDTFTGKLAYVIYYDDKKKLRKETSWNSWRDKTIDTMEIPNDPTDGFTMNKGFTRYSDWGSGRAVIRMWDQRDFEFEIGLDNLVGILMHSDVSKREIGEKCVFAWKGSELILLPVNTEEYQSSIKYTQKQGNRVSAKDLVPGYTYVPKKQTIPHIYLGRFAQYKEEGGSYYNNEPREQIGGAKKHWFQPTLHSYEGATGILQAETKDPTSFLSHADAEEVHTDYATYLDALHSTPLVQKIVGYVETSWEPMNKCRYGHYLNVQSFYVKVSDEIYIKFDVKNNTNYNSSLRTYTYNIKVTAKHVIHITAEGRIDVDHVDHDRYGYSYPQTKAKRVSSFGVTLASPNVLVVVQKIATTFEYPDWWSHEKTVVEDDALTRLDTHIKDNIMITAPNAVNLCWVLENGKETKGLNYGY